MKHIRMSKIRTDTKLFEKVSNEESAKTEASDDKPAEEPAKTEASDDKPAEEEKDGASD